MNIYAITDHPKEPPMAYVKAKNPAQLVNALNRLEKPILDNPTVLSATNGQFEGEISLKVKGSDQKIYYLHAWPIEIQY